MTVKHAPPSRFQARLFSPTLSRWAISAALLLSAGAASAIPSVTLYVDPTGIDSNDGTSPASAFLTIQAAIAAADNGSTINIADGTYTGTGDVDLDTGGKSLTIQSDHGAASTIIDCGGSSSADHRGFYIHHGEAVSITGLTIKNGYESNDNGGGVNIINSSATLESCIISGNTSTSGGGIFNQNYDSNTANSTLTLTNCLVSGNIAQGSGGGIYNGRENDGPGSGSGTSGTTTLINSTITGNTGNGGNGGGIYDFNDNFMSSGSSNATALINCVVYGDTGGEIAAYEYGGSLTLTACDVQGGVPSSVMDGGSNIDADPLFVSTTDFHLLPGSLALGAGTSTGAPTTDLSGATRPSFPSIGAYEVGVPHIVQAPSAWAPVSVSVGANNTTHVLWDNADGGIALWNYSTADGSVTYQEYGPYAGWTGKAVADGADGKTRILWNNADGSMSVWSLNAQTGDLTHSEYGPYAGWTATAISVDASNVSHILWDNTDGSVSVWNLTADGSMTHGEYGPYAGWTGKAVADGTDGKTRLLWDNTDGSMAVWSLNTTDGSFSHHEYGPYAGWTADAMSVGTDNATHVLWNNASGSVALWNVDAVTGDFTHAEAAPASGWSAKGVADGPDGQSRILGTDTSGAMSVWSMDSLLNGQTPPMFGPYSR